MTALLRWYRAGLDVQSRLPFLAASMGHVSIVSTAYYLQFVEPLAVAASARFADHCGAHHGPPRCGRCAMTAAGPNDLARALRAFFVDHLPRVRGTSPHTIQSYRDSLVLLLRFVTTRTHRSVIQLDLDDLGPQPILAFLQYLELDRHNRVATRNVRLAAVLHSRAGHRAGPARQAPPSPQHAAQHGCPPAPRRRRHRHDQSVARPRQCHDHAPVRDRRSRHETTGAREGASHRPRHRGTGRVAHRRVRTRMA